MEKDKVLVVRMAPETREVMVEVLETLQENLQSNLAKVIHTKNLLNSASPIKVEIAEVRETTPSPKRKYTHRTVAPLLGNYKELANDINKFLIKADKPMTCKDISYALRTTYGANTSKKFKRFRGAVSFCLFNNKNIWNSETKDGIKRPLYYSIKK